MRAETVLAKLTAGTITNYDVAAGGGENVDRQALLMAMRGLPELESNLLYAKWMGDESAGKSAERQLLLRIIDWPLYDEKSRSGELRRNAGILRALCHVAIQEVVRPPLCGTCKGGGWDKQGERECRVCGGHGTKVMGNLRRSRLANEYIRCTSKNTWARWAVKWGYDEVYKYAADREKHGIRHMQKRLRSAA